MGESGNYAKFNGDAVAQTIEALDIASKDPNKSAFTTLKEQPRWTYINMTDDQWLKLSKEEKVNVIKKMNQQEGRYSGFFVGSPSQQNGQSGNVTGVTNQDLINMGIPADRVGLVDKEDRLELKTADEATKKQMIENFKTMSVSELKNYGKAPQAYTTFMNSLNPKSITPQNVVQTFNQIKQTYATEDEDKIRDAFERKLPEEAKKEYYKDFYENEIFGKAKYNEDGVDETREEEWTIKDDIKDALTKLEPKEVVKILEEK